MRKIDIFVSSPVDVLKERSLVERLIRSIAAEFGVPITVSYSNWLRRPSPSDKVTALGTNGFEEGRSLLCPCFWEYQDFKPEPDYRERIPNTGQYDLVICILWSRLGTRISPAFVMPDGSQPTSATEYEIAWVLDQTNRTPGFPELHVYRNRSTPVAPLEPKEEREISFEQWDSVQEFFSTWKRRNAFLEVCNDYQDLQEFEGLFRGHFRAFLAKQLEREILPRKRSQSAPYWKSNPYRGLQFFDFEHAPIFHGRTKAIGEVFDTLRTQAISKSPFVLILGTRGSGKSSLARAGVLPLLTEVGAANGPWRRAVTRPGAGGTAGDPFERLVTALLADSALPELQNMASHNGHGNLASQLREDPDRAAVRLAEILDMISLQELDRLLEDEERTCPLPGRIEGAELARHRLLRRVKPKAHLALVVDQLEDLFVAGHTAEVQHRYIAALVGLIRCRRIYVIATLQSDFYASFQQFPELAELARAGGRFDLEPPTREELGNMIRWPAAAAGLCFERDSESGLGLDEALIDAATVNSELLPLLEHLLSQMYRKQLARKDGLLAWSDYRELGELEGALSRHAETLFRELGSDEQEAFSLVMRHLVSLGSGDGSVRRSVLYRDLVSPPEFDHRQKVGVKGFVDRYTKEELFSAETGREEQIIVTISHEALLRRWARVRSWLAEEQGFLRMRDRLDANVKLWLSRNCQCEDLLGSEFGVEDAQTLLRHFRSALNQIQIDYLQKILEKEKWDRLRNKGWFVVGAGLTVVATVAGILWYSAEIHRKRAAELARFEQRVEELTKERRSAPPSRVQQAKDKPKMAAQNADIPIKEGNALETRLKKAEAKAQLAQQNADLAATQRSAMEAELKSAEQKAQVAQQNAELAATRRSAMEAKLKSAEEKAQSAQLNSDLAATQRPATEAELKSAEEEAQTAQLNADLATTRLSAMETDLKSAEEKGQAAQNVANIAVTQRTEMETELKKAREQLTRIPETGQMAEKSAELVANQAKSVPSPSNATAAEAIPAEPQVDESPKSSGDEQLLKKFVFDYLQTAASDDVSTQESFFAHRVAFYDQGVISLRKVEEAKESYDRQWPNRNWKPQGELEILPSTNPRIYEVLQPFSWTASDGSRNDQGSGKLYLRIWKNSKGEFHIVHIERQ
jgi:hypothetical protein